MKTKPMMTLIERYAEVRIQLQHLQQADSRADSLQEILDESRAHLLRLVDILDVVMPHEEDTPLHRRIAVEEVRKFLS